MSASCVPPSIPSHPASICECLCLHSPDQRLLQQRMAKRIPGHRREHRGCEQGRRRNALSLGWKEAENQCWESGRVGRASSAKGINH